MTISSAEQKAFRLSVIGRETPRALGVTGMCFVTITLINAAFGAPIALTVLGLNAAVSVLLLGGAALGRTSFMRPGAWSWFAAVCALAMVADGLVQVWLSPDGASFAYVLLIVVAYAPLTLAWLPTAVAAVPMLIGCVVVSRQWPSSEATDWVIASVAAVAIGMSLLWLRLRSLDEMAALDAQVKTLATRDRLTGALNRLGIEERLPELVGMATRKKEPVFAMFLDIDGLKQINDYEGHEAGDRVIAAVAASVRSAVRAADIVGRWGGDEFIVLGLGVALHPDQFTARILDLVRSSGIDVNHTCIGVSTGAATVACDALDVEALIGLADEDMYLRRRARRATRG